MTIDEAINILKQYVDYDNPDVPDFYTMEEAIKVIIEALEQEPKTGYWIDNKARTNLCNCSECGALSKAYSKYCPNCGAKMEVTE